MKKSTLLVILAILLAMAIVVVLVMAFLPKTPQDSLENSTPAQGQTQNTTQTQGQGGTPPQQTQGTTQPACANGHNVVVLQGYGATCTTTGMTDGVICSVCAAVLQEQQVIPVKNHTEVIDAAVEANCTAPGLTEGKHCSVCSAVLVKQESIPRKEHVTVIDPAVPATCTATGLTEGKHCSVCNSVLMKQEVTPKTDHMTVVDAAVPATCTVNGLSEGSHCGSCNTVLASQYTIYATGHSYSQWQTTRQPTCTAEGQQTRTCSKCRNQETQSLSKTNHSYSGGKCQICNSAEPATEGLEYSLSSDGRSYYVSGWSDYRVLSKKIIIVPETYNGKPVTGIKEYAFSAFDMQEIILPDTITTIERFAFHFCEKLKTIRIPDSVVFIGGNAFYNCGNLETVYINTTGWTLDGDAMDFRDPYETGNHFRNKRTTENYIRG